jgi:alpha-1,3-rhamnosyl/mannosyltransferase
VSGAARSTQRVGVNLLWLVPGVVGGSEEYTVRLLLGLRDLAPHDLEVELFALHDLVVAHPELADAYPVTELDLRGRVKPLRIAAESTWLPAVTRRGLDVVHHAGGVVPPVRGSGTPVLTIHDLQPLDLPENFGAAKARYLATMLPRSARAARLVLVPSDTVARRVVSVLGIEPARVRTIPHGLDPAHHGPVAEAEVARVRAAYGLPARWITYPVITYPHKNHLALVRSFVRVATEVPDVDLVLTGGEGPAEAEVRAAIAATGVPDRIHRTGRVPGPDVDALVGGAQVVAFPSRYEGFGNGVLEAMARGVPVVAAGEADLPDATSLPEVLGGAGVLVGPDDVDGWSDALLRLLRDPEHHAERRAAGLARAAGYGDAAAAEALADAYRDAASGPARA